MYESFIFHLFYFSNTKVVSVSISFNFNVFVVGYFILFLSAPRNRILYTR